MANRKTKRAAKAQARKGKATNNPQPVIVKYNKHGKALTAARAHSIASETSDKTTALTKELVLCWNAIHAGDMAVTTEHTRLYLEEVRAGIIAARKRNEGRHAEEPGEVIASRVGDFNAQLHLNSYVCRDNLITALNKFDGLTSRGITAVARWMRGPHGKGGNWSAEIAKAPTHDTLARVIKASKKKNTRTSTGTTKRNGPTGMPTSEGKEVKGLGHVIACLAAFDKAYARKLLGASERKVIAQAHDGLKGLFNPLRAAVKAKAAADAKAAAAKAKADK